LKPGAFVSGVEMKKDELVERLKQFGIDPHWGGAASWNLVFVQCWPGEDYALRQEKSGLWKVVYSERGTASEPEIFFSEDEACSRFWEMLEWERGAQSKKKRAEQRPA